MIDDIVAGGAREKGEKGGPVETKQTRNKPNKTNITHIHLFTERVRLQFFVFDLRGYNGLDITECRLCVLVDKYLSHNTSILFYSSLFSSICFEGGCYSPPTFGWSRRHCAPAKRAPSPPRRSPESRWQTPARRSRYLYIVGRATVHPTMRFPFICIQAFIATQVCGNGHLIVSVLTVGLVTKPFPQEIVDARTWFCMYSM